MNELIALIGVVYACNMMAAQAPVSASVAFQCVQAREAVKMKFLTDEEIAQLEGLPLREQNKIKLKGYQRFKAWEDDNPSVVKNIRDTQYDKLTSSLSF